jgi:hypothetical protein
MNRRVRLASIALFSVMASLGVATAQQLTESFDATFPPTGWLVRNQSQSIGTNPNCWNQFTGTTPWATHTGAGQTGANFNCAGGADTISGWLISAPIANFQNGNQISFWTRTATASGFPDRLEVRICLDVAAGSCGLAGSTGATFTDVGSFTTLIRTINPALAVGGYPEVFTLFTDTLSGLPAGPNPGRVAFRYFVTSGGPAGANANIISIDDVVVTATTPVELMSYEVD